MRVEFDYQLSRDEYVAGLTPLTDQLGRQDSSRTRRILEQLAMVVVIIAAIGIVFPGALPGLLAAAVLLTLLTGAFTPRWMRGATGQSYDPAVIDLHIEISDSGIVERTPMRERRWEWGAVRRIHENHGVLAFELAGWDMLVLPYRLWDSDDERAEFTEQLRLLASAALPISKPRSAARTDTRDLLTIGAIAAAVDILAIFAFAMPVYSGSGEPIGSGVFLGMFAAILLIGCVAAYLGYRFARRGLDRLHDRSPWAAVALAHALVWAVPFYMVLDYFGLA